MAKEIISYLGTYLTLLHFIVVLLSIAVLFKFSAMMLSDFELLKKTELVNFVAVLAIVLALPNLFVQLISLFHKKSLIGKIHCKSCGKENEICLTQESWYQKLKNKIYY